MAAMLFLFVFQKHNEFCCTLSPRYSQRSRSVLQLGSSNESEADAAWIAILMGGLQREGQLYQMDQLPSTLRSFQTQHSKLRSQQCPERRGHFGD